MNFDVDIEVDLGGTTFISFDETSNTLTIPSNTTTEDDLGSHAVKIKLKSQEAQSEKTYIIYFIILPPETKNEVKNETVSEEIATPDTPSKLPPTALQPSVTLQTPKADEEMYIQIPPKRKSSL